jgi:hypothetical protein
MMRMSLRLLTGGDWKSAPCARPVISTDGVVGDERRSERTLEHRDRTGEGNTMRLSRALLTIIFGMSAQAQNSHPIIPHVEGDGGVTWVAIIDATTVTGLLHAAPSANRSDHDYDNKPLVALNSWLDGRLSAVGWCSYGWYYLTTDPNYIKVLSNGQLRVRGGCRKPSPQGDTLPCQHANGPALVPARPGSPTSRPGTSACVPSS